jgi:hypothetical protein
MKVLFYISILLFGISRMAISQEFILDEDFENGIPANWSIIDGDGFTVNSSVSEFQPAWIGLDDPFIAGNKIAGSTSYFEPEGKAFRFLVTPQLSLGSYGNILSWKSMSHDPSFPDWIMILASTTGNNLEDFTDTLFRLTNEFPYWTEREINLSDSGYVDMDIYLAFVNHTNQGFKLYVDSVQVEINNPVSVPNESISEVVIYPNPTSTNQINLHSENEILNLTIVDASGRVVLQKNNPNNSLDVSALEHGLYFAQVQTNKGIQTIRFQKL